MSAYKSTYVPNKSITDEERKTLLANFNEFACDSDTEEEIQYSDIDSEGDVFVE